MKSKIKTIKVYEKTDKFGNKSAGVTMEDGIFGFYSFTGDLSIKEGMEVDYSFTEHDNKSKPGEKYKKLTITIPSPPPPKTAEIKSSVPNNPALIPLKATASIKAMEFVVNAFIADKINYDKIPEYYKELKGYLFDALDEIGS